MIMSPSLANPLASFSIQKRPERQFFVSKMCPDDSFSGFQSGGPNFVKKFVENLSNDNFRANFQQIFDRFSTDFRQIFDKIWVLLQIGTPKNNRRDKLLTNLGFGAFLNAVRGRRVGSQPQPASYGSG